MDSSGVLFRPSARPCNYKITSRKRPCRTRPPQLGERRPPSAALARVGPPAPKGVAGQKAQSEPSRHDTYPDDTRARSLGRAGREVRVLYKAKKSEPQAATWGSLSAGNSPRRYRITQLILAVYLYRHKANEGFPVGASPRYATLTREYRCFTPICSPRTSRPPSQRPASRSF